MSPEDERRENERTHHRKRLLELNETITKYYEYRLYSASGAAGGQYLTKRGISPDTAKQFRLGFAGDDAELTDILVNSGYSHNELIQAFVCKARDNGQLYEVFRNRVMFPISDVNGQIVGFSGRTVLADPPDWEPKYKNSGETICYTKGEHLYGLNLAKTSAKQSPFLIAEGNLDVVSLHSAGFNTAVAALGTAFTDRQALLIRKYVDEVTLCYDNDNAGRAATSKTLPILEKCGVRCKILRIPDGRGKDPDEYIRIHGADGFRELLANTRNPSAVFLDDAKNGLNLDEPAARVEYLNKATDILTKIANKSERAVYISEVAAECRVSAELLSGQIENATGGKVKYEKRRLENATSQTAVTNIRATNNTDSEAAILAFMLYAPDFIGDIMAKITEECFSDSVFKAVWQIFVKLLADGVEPNEYAAQELPPKDTAKFAAAMRKSREIPFTKERLSSCVHRLKKNSVAESTDIMSIINRTKIRKS
jgi:DNA primase